MAAKLHEIDTKQPITIIHGKVITAVKRLRTGKKQDQMEFTIFALSILLLE